MAKEEKAANRNLPKAEAGVQAASYPAQCRYCGERVVSWRNQVAHMVTRHPA